MFNLTYVLNSLNDIQHPTLEKSQKIPTNWITIRLHWVLPIGIINHFDTLIQRNRPSWWSSFTPHNPSTMHEKHVPFSHFPTWFYVRPRSPSHKTFYIHGHVFFLSRNSSSIMHPSAIMYTVYRHGSDGINIHSRNQRHKALPRAVPLDHLPAAGGSLYSTAGTLSPFRLLPPPIPYRSP